MNKVLKKRGRRGTSNSHADRLESAIGLDRRAEFAQAHLERLQGIFKTLLADENFLTLLRAESIKTIPHYLKIPVERAGKKVPRSLLSQDGIKANVSGLSFKAPKTLALDQLTLTICCRYADSLLANRKIKGYLAKHHSSQFADLENSIEECEQCVKQEGIHSVLLKSATRK